MLETVEKEKKKKIGGEQILLIKLNTKIKQNIPCFRYFILFLGGGWRIKGWRDSVNFRHRRKGRQATGLKVY